MDGLLSERYADQLDGMLSCYDRIVITGSLMPFCYAQGMTRYLYQHEIRIFDYAKFGRSSIFVRKVNARKTGFRRS